MGLRRSQSQCDMRVGKNCSRAPLKAPGAPPVFFFATPRGAMQFQRPMQRNSNPVGVDVLWALGVWLAPPLRGLA